MRREARQESWTWMLVVVHSLSEAPPPSPANPLSLVCLILCHFNNPLEHFCTVVLTSMSRVTPIVSCSRFLIALWRQTLVLFIRVINCAMTRPSPVHVKCSDHWAPCRLRPVDIIDEYSLHHSGLVVEQFNFQAENFGWSTSRTNNTGKMIYLDQCYCHPNFSFGFWSPTAPDRPKNLVSTRSEPLLIPFRIENRKCYETSPFQCSADFTNTVCGISSRPHFPTPKLLKWYFAMAKRWKYLANSLSEAYHGISW